MATHSNILFWRIPWTAEPGGLYSPWDRTESDTTEQLTHKHTHTLYVGASLVAQPVKTQRNVSFISGSGKSPGEGNSTCSSILAYVGI